MLKISTCSGFKTLANAETQFSSGLRSTGVGMCVCARHEIVRAGGVGDLQKGERYMVYYQSIAEADNMALGIAIWTIFCFPPSPRSLWWPFSSLTTSLASSSSSLQRVYPNYQQKYIFHHPSPLNGVSPSAIALCTRCRVRHPTP